ncbi:MAG: hypothetical protein ACBR13_07860 [Microcoleus sp.]
MKLIFFNILNKSIGGITDTFITQIQQKPTFIKAKNCTNQRIY